MTRICPTINAARDLYAWIAEFKERRGDDTLSESEALTLMTKAEQEGYDRLVDRVQSSLHTSPEGSIIQLMIAYAVSDDIELGAHRSPKLRRMHANFQGTIEKIADHSDIDFLSMWFLQRPFDQWLRDGVRDFDS